jgi:DnaJ-class molecular chaperone
MRGTDVTAGADPHDLLGVARDATCKDIQKAFHCHARKVHPDLNPGDETALRKFQALTVAYDMLKRLRSAHGEDRHYRLPVDFLDAVHGASWRIIQPDGACLEIVIPPGTSDRQTLRLPGKGGAGRAGGEAGDAVVEIVVCPHPFFKCDGRDIHLDLPISLAEAVLGGKVAVPTPAGPVVATIPRGSNSGRILRLKGRGMVGRDGRTGDAYLTLRLMLPDPPDPELEAFVARRWRPRRAGDPRRKPWP